MICFLTIASILAFLVYQFILKPHKYWQKHGVPQTPQFPLFGNNYRIVFKKDDAVNNMLKAYNAFPNARYSGIYEMTKPVLLLRDPELIKQITMKDFDHFLDHRTFMPDGVEPLWNKNLFALTGTKWKHMRAILSPLFTSSKIKLMFTLMSECAKEFTDKITEESKDGQCIEFKQTIVQFTNDVIASTAFGLSVNSSKDSENEFFQMGKRLTKFSGFKKTISFLLLNGCPSLARKLGLRLFDNIACTFFVNLITRTLRMREEQGIVRPDLLHSLLEARKGALKNDDDNEIEAGFATVQESDIGKVKKTIKKEDLTDLDICAQAIVFFFGGFDSVSTELSFMAYELAVNPDIQDKLRQEIDKTLEQCKGNITYEAIIKMKYMDMVVSEVLRMWPNNFMTDRNCTKAYTIQPETPDERPVHLKKNQSVTIPIMAIHRDPKYYSEPNRFDPVRFSDENKGSIKPYTYFPFGAGPRNCIGSRFGLLEMKILFFYLLSKVELVPNAKTPIPMQFIKGSIGFQPDPGFYIDLKLRK